MQGLAQIELWTRHSEESSSRCLTENAKNPLDLPEIREKIFKHLSPTLAYAIGSENKKYLKDLLHCRMVCCAWKCSATDFIKITLDSDSRIESYLNLISTNPNPPDANDPTKFISTRFEFNSNEINYEGVEFISFMETCGAHIKNLSFQESGLTYYSILMLPIWCPDLIQLELNLEYKEPFYGLLNFSHDIIPPKIFQSAWEKPFKSLQSLCYNCYKITDHDDDTDSDNVIQVSNELFCWILFKLPKLKRHLFTSHLNFQSYFESHFETQIGVLERLECLIVPTPVAKNELEILCQMNLFCLRHLVITELDMSTSGECFYRLLENVANTLEILLVCVKDKETDNSDFRLPFPALNKLVVLAVENLDKFVAPNEFYSLFQKFPSLMFVEFGNWNFKEATSNSFWNGIFPKLENPIGTQKTFTHYHLSLLIGNFLIYKANSSIVLDIAQSFPGLDSVWLKVEGEVFMNLVHELRYHKIRKLAIDFYMSETGIMAIPAALMGLDLDTCAQLLDNREDYKSFEHFKVWTSLSDWKYLKQLQIQNCGYANSPLIYNSDAAKLFSDTQIEWVAVWYALTKLAKLETLSILYFKIHERLILRMLKKTNVNLHLGRCLIEMCKPQGIAAVNSTDYIKDNPRDRLFDDERIFNKSMNFDLFGPIFTYVKGWSTST